MFKSCNHHRKSFTRWPVSWYYFIYLYDSRIVPIDHTVYYMINNIIHLKFVDGNYLASCTDGEPMVR